jgi:hypothetical protein
MWTVERTAPVRIIIINIIIIIIASFPNIRLAPRTSRTAWSGGEIFPHLLQVLQAEVGVCFTNTRLFH